MWVELVGASWHICGASLYKYGASWLGRVGINMGRACWGELVWYGTPYSDTTRQKVNKNKSTIYL